MAMPTFHEWLKMRTEGLWLNDKAAIPGMSRINPFPATQERLKKMAPKPVKPLKPPAAPVGQTPKPAFLTPTKPKKVPRPRLP